MQQIILTLDEMGVYTDTYSSKEKTLLLPWIVGEVARRRGVSSRQAFAELRTAKALDFYDRCFGVLHTYSIEAADAFYSSDLAAKLEDPATGLYFQSPGYAYSYL